MITQVRKGKNKHVVLFSPAVVDDEHCELREWCEQMFGPGGRNKKYRWRYGWTDTENTYHFKNAQDATLFILRWA